MSKIYLGNGKSELNLATRSIILSEDEESEILNILNPDMETVEELREKIQNIENKVSDRDAEIEELQIEVREYEDQRREMTAMDLMEYLLEKFSDMKISEIMTMRNSFGIYDITPAVKFRDFNDLDEVLYSNK